MRCKNCQRRWKRNFFARQLTPRKDQKKHSEICEITKIPTFRACLGKPRVIWRRGTLTQFRQRVAIGWTRIYKHKQYTPRIQEFSSMMLSRHRRIIPSLKRSSRRCTKNVDPWSLPKNSITLAVHFQNHQNDALRCIIFGIYAWDDVVLTQQPKAVVLQSGALFAWIEKADQNPQIICRDDPQEDQMFYFWSYTIGKSPYKSIIENQEIKKVGLSKTHASGNLHSLWWKANWRNKYQQERSRRTWNDEVWEFLEGFCTYTHRTQTTNWRFVLSRWSWSDECFSLDRDFSDNFFRVSYTCSGNYSVYDGSVHTLTCRTHIFLVHTHSVHISHIFMRVTYTHGSSVCKKVFAHVSFLSISPSPSLPCDSPIFAVPARSLRDHSWLRLHWRLRHSQVLVVLSRLKSVGHAPLRTCIAKFGHLAKSDANTGYEPKEFDKIDHFCGQWHGAHQRSEPQFLQLLENHEREH